jgi:hypothetical protein
MSSTPVLASRTLPLALAAIAATAAAAASQTVYRVGPHALPTIQDAVDAASAGDVVEVAAGVYPSFHVEKALRIVAEPSALVQVDTTDTIAIALQPNDRVHLAGLDVQAQAVTVHGGIVSAERCTIRTGLGVRLRNTIATLRWSSASADSASGVLVEDSTLFASDGTFSTGAPAADHIEHGGVKVLGDSACHLASCVLIGAWCVSAAMPWPSVAFLAPTATAANARIWLVDCNFIGGFQQSGPQGPSLVVPSVPMPGRVRAHRCQASGLVIGAVVLDRVLGVHTSVDMNVGGSFTTRMLGEPGHPLLLYAGGETLGQQPVTFVEQPALVFNDMVVLGTLPGDAQGAATFTINVPNNPALRHLQIWWRGLDLATLPWQATPPFVTIVQ